MEPIPIFFENVRRSAVVVTPKQPFYDWLAVIDPADTKERVAHEGDVYLLPDFEEVTEMEKWLKKHFDLLFSDQLNNWYTDETIWPQKRNFAMFGLWFNYSLHTMVWDTLKQPVTKI